LIATSDLQKPACHFPVFLFQLFEVVDFILNLVIFPEMVDAVKNLNFPRAFSFER